MPMDATYESIQYQNKYPYKVFLSNLQLVQNHWHNSLEIVLVIRGKAVILQSNQTQTLEDLDFTFINSGEVHSVMADGNTLMLTLQLSRQMFEALVGDKVKFKVRSDAAARTEVIRHLAQILWVYNKKAEHYRAKLQALIYALVFVMLEHYAYEAEPRPDTSEKHNTRIEAIIRYVNEHYNEDISLKSLAEREFLSISYLSRFFKRYVGVSYKDYISSIRLEHAVNDLIHTDVSIQEISLRNGFASVKSLSQEFKKIYDTTISDFRKRNKTIAINRSLIRRASNYTELTHSKAFYALFRYIDTPTQTAQAERSGVAEQIDLTAKTPTPFTHYWKAMTSVGKAAHLLREDVRQQIVTARQEIGFEQIKFHGLFDDAMMVLCQYKGEQPVYNFNYIYKVFDFLFANGMRPFVSLGFMPQLLALNPQPYFFDRSFPCAPAVLDRWTQLVQAFLGGIIGRYGIERISGLQFEIWNEPELMNAFWNSSPQEYYALWGETYHAIKKISPHFSVGGPSVSNTDDIESWIRPFMEYCIQHNCRPDFFSYHVYPHCDTVDELAGLLISGKKSPVFSPNPHYLATSIQIFMDMLLPYGYDYSNIIINEWNSSASHNELTHDTCYKSCYIVKQLTENINKIAVVNHWTLSDIIEEFPLAPQEFYGGLGLITQNGVKKPAYYAYTLLGRLGDQFLTRGNYYFITKDKNGLQILLFNYCHFDHMYCNNERSHISDTDRYNVFADDLTRHLQLELCCDLYGDVVVTEYTLDRTNGSAYDAYNQFSYGPVPTAAEIAYLQTVTPAIKKQRAALNGRFVIDATLTPHAVKLFTLEPVYSNLTK